MSESLTPPAVRTRPLSVSRVQTIGLVLCVALAGLTAGVLSFNRARASYRVSVLVFVGEALGGTRNSFELSPLIADFQTVVLLPATAAEVAKTVGVDQDFVTRGLQTQRDGAGTGVRVSFTGPSERKANEIASEASLAAIRRLASRNSVQSEQTAQELEESIASIDDQINKILLEARVPDIEVYFGQLSDQLVRVRAGELAGSTGDTQDTLQSELRRLQPLLDQQRRLTARRGTYEQLLASTVLESEQSQTTLRRLESGSSFVRLATVQIGRTAVAIRSAVAGGVLAALVFAGYLIWSSRRRAKRSRNLV